MLNEAITAYSALSSKNKVRFLTRIAHELTIQARGVYGMIDDDPQTAARLLKSMNELEHKIIGEQIHHLENHQHRYPDDVFVNILYEMAQPAQCQKWIEEVFQDLYSSHKSSQN